MRSHFIPSTINAIAQFPKPNKCVAVRLVVRHRPLSHQPKCDRTSQNYQNAIALHPINNKCDRTSPTPLRRSHFLLNPINAIALSLHHKGDRHLLNLNKCIAQLFIVRANFFSHIRTSGKVIIQPITTSF
ncbi:hypothetical protein [Nostoc sp. TCL26-01]|uniref:hypothetical protein n=1 Tax=Nostoc sp. TCL26-01 TaxID=2576904 RepID=UPI0015BA7130|nr:hypothetical protein [Nostoc sp. TCL26-01]QLE56501.1 hypothetical protein FD725_13830 [Nostoc sp. TCL26-01]